MNRIIFLVGIVAVLLASGCGSGSGENIEPETGRGAINFRIEWPEQTRLIPEGANSIKITLAGPSTVERVVPRPASGQTVSAVSISGLIVGNYNITSKAYPSLDASGVAQAQGFSAVVITKDQTSSASLSMASTISSVSVIGANTVGVGTSSQIMGSAKDAAGNTVISSNGNWQWGSSNSSIATVSASGNPAVVTGINEGSVVITGTEVESGKKVTFNIESAYDKGILDLDIQ